MFNNTMELGSTTKALALLAFICFTSITTTLADIPRPRGVSLAKATLYQPRADKSWVCLDNSKTIPYLQINDDYCDCADGSDEPGTSACNNGQFHCANLGHKPQNVPSSRVNDGICDCCDGSDEYATVPCTNTCQQMGNAELEQRRTAAELHQRGAAKRLEMIKQGKQLKADRESRKLELNHRLREQAAIKDEKEQLKHNAETLEAEALEVYKEQQRELDEQTVKAEEEPMEQRIEANAAFVRFDSNKDGFVEVTELMVDMTFDRDHNGVVTVDEAKYILDERERMDLDTFLTLAWPRIKPLKMLAEGIFKPPLAEGQDEAADMAQFENDNEHKNIDDDTVADTDEAHDLEHETEVELEEDGYEDDEADVGVGEATPESTPAPVYDPETQRLIERANEARNAFEEVERHIREIEQEVKEIDDQNNKDYGPNEEYAVMDGECYNYEDREYIYTLCPFDRASQKQRSGGAETTLGRWDQWLGDENNKYSKQKYAHGASCWNGPQRSVVVELRCALEHRITGVTEPNRCEYFFEFETPAACDSEAFAAAEQNQHDEL